MNHDEIRFKTDALRKSNGTILSKEFDGYWYCVYESEAMHQGSSTVEYVKHEEFKKICRDEKGNYTKCENFSQAKVMAISGTMSSIKGLQDNVKRIRVLRKKECLNYNQN